MIVKRTAGKHVTKLLETSKTSLKTSFQNFPRLIELCERLGVLVGNQIDHKIFRGTVLFQSFGTHFGRFHTI